MAKEPEQTNKMTKGVDPTQALLQQILEGQTKASDRIDGLEESLDARLTELEQRKRKSAPASDSKIDEVLEQNKELMERNNQLVGQVAKLEGNQGVLVANTSTYSKSDVQAEIDRQNSQFDTSSKGKYTYWMTRFNIGEMDDREIPMNYTAFEFRCDIKPDEIQEQVVRVDGEPDYKRMIITGNTKESVVSEYRKYSGEDIPTNRIRVEEAKTAERAAA